MTTKIGTTVVDLNGFHIFINFQSDDRLRGRSLLQSRNLLAKICLQHDLLVSISFKLSNLW